VLVYFTCDDCRVEEKRVNQFGGQIQKTKESIDQHGFMSLVRDTERNMIGLRSMN
jgi:predicted enzyme related to lactoylglutathione lyase